MILRRMLQSLSGVGTTKQTKKAVGYMLLGSSAFVFSIVVVGGVTRLTESGLSMIDWSLLHYRFPKSKEEWENYFELYKQSPEYKMLNQGMSLESYKFIYFMEYSHRMLGRCLGLGFLAGTIIFQAKGFLSPEMRNRMWFMNALIMTQGLLGWYMVKSGLDPKIIDEGGVPRVSQYRLAAHLGTAFFLYSNMLYNGLRIVLPSKVGEPHIQPRFIPYFLTGIIGLTAISGAFVAGLDAGLIYDTFPLMGGKIVPSDALVLKPTWKNIFENPSCVQFVHRSLGISTFASIMVSWMYCRRRNLPRSLMVPLNFIAGISVAQVCMGIGTLLYMVPISLAALHQAGSLTLLSASIWFLERVRSFKK